MLNPPNDFQNIKVICKYNYLSMYIYESKIGGIFNSANIADKVFRIIYCFDAYTYIFEFDAFKTVCIILMLAKVISNNY